MSKPPAVAAAKPRRSLLRTSLARPGPVRLVALGYGLYMLMGALVLAQPFATDADARFIDHLFIAVSAVSTTGLASIDPGGTYSFLGEAVLLLLIQAGGIGFMTVNSVVWMTLTDGRPSRLQRDVARSVFALPPGVPVRAFLGRVVLYTAVIEVAGAVALWALFAQAGIEDALWHGVFHSVSAFCTAGFSLFATSFEAFSGNLPVLAVIALLSILGAIGFLVAHEAYDRITGRTRRLSVSSRLIIVVSALMIGGGTLLLVLAEPQVAAMPWPQRLTNGFFQAMTASTTVGFNSIPVAPYAHVAVMATYIMMLVGASPSGTGGGLKSTTVAVQWAFLWATLRGRDHVTLRGVAVPEAKVRQAIATFFIAATVLTAAMLALTALEPELPFDKLLFEAISALGTVGLSLGITANLSDPAKLVVIALMYAGRIGIMAFGLLLVVRQVRAEPAPQAEDVAL
jgi:trk system potassium uptake protein TrkH